MPTRTTKPRAAKRAPKAANATPEQPLLEVPGPPAVERVGPFDDERYLPTLGVTLGAGQTVTVKNNEIEEEVDGS